jgi:transglutaminase-like putative cysteine protease
LSDADGITANGSVRVVSCDLLISVVEPAEIVLQLVAAGSAGQVLDERFTIDVGDGQTPLLAEELVVGGHRSKMHILSSGPGPLRVGYRSEVRAGVPGTMGRPVGPPPSYDQQVYLRPSRYCPSDHLVGFAVAEFGVGSDISGRVDAITEWIRTRIGYVSGSSSVHDSAEDTLLTATGTCRDFAHLAIALCRATGIPARFAAVYAPGLSPMDFHAVFETCVAGTWYVHDATGLAPRSSLVRIATGRDAADTAFVSVTRGIASLEELQVTATVVGLLPADDHTQRALLA